MREDKDALQRREIVAGLYGPKWKSQVAKMPYSQVIAIYLKHQQTSREAPEPKTSLSHPTQLRLDL